MKNNENSILKDYKLHLTVLFISIISLAIGTVSINITLSYNLILLPLMYSIFLAVLSYIHKPVKWINKEQSMGCAGIMLILICPLIAKLSLASGQNIDILMAVGLVLLLKELGTVGTVLVGLPIALFLGFRVSAKILYFLQFSNIAHSISYFI